MAATGAEHERRSLQWAPVDAVAHVSAVHHGLAEFTHPCAEIGNRGQRLRIGSVAERPLETGHTGQTEIRHPADPLGQRQSGRHGAHAGPAVRHAVLHQDRKAPAQRRITVRHRVVQRQRHRHAVDVAAEFEVRQAREQSQERTDTCRVDNLVGHEYPPR